MKLPEGKKAILLMGLPLGLAAAGVLAFTQLSASSSGPPPVPDPADGEHGVMLALEERVINLGSGNPFAYVKVGVTVELRPETAEFYGFTGEARATAEGEAIKAEEGAVPLLLDALGTTVSAQDGKALATPEGREALKAALLDAYREILGEREVLDVYFTDLVMQ